MTISIDSPLRSPTRRKFVKSAAALLPLAAARAASSNTSSYIYIGCLTHSDHNSRGDGIHVYRMDQQTGALTHIQRLGNLVNPSSLIVSRDQHFLYSAHGDEAYASSFAIEKGTGLITPLDQAATGGSNGVFHTIDPSGRFMVIANYGDKVAPNSPGSCVSVLPIRNDGSLRDRSQVVELKGALGPDRLKQASPQIPTISFLTRRANSFWYRTKGLIASSYFASINREAC